MFGQQHGLELDLEHGDQREDHRENRDGLDDTERGEVVGEALSGFGLCVARGCSGTPLE